VCTLGLYVTVEMFFGGKRVFFNSRKRFSPQWKFKYDGGGIVR